jgi:flagellar protein FlaF
MQDAARAYRVASAHTANPRALEANLLLKAAAKLKAVQNAGGDDAAQFDEALLYNRKAWVMFMAAVTSPETPLPVAIRENVANLGMFVLNRTLELMAGRDPARLGSLIRINCELAAGLSGNA